MSVRKTEEERLEELNRKIEQIKAKKMQLETRLKEKERKARTKRLIEVGAIFEKYFEIEGQEEAEKIAVAFRHLVLKKKNEILHQNIEQIEKLVQPK